ncbi:hypothetical protein NUW54_g12860 [Trametes sanguinea]|uniref:Uncharacterized protein n=1 Tax=Trametes sanguinea TaxID=158606 RepID=A0ACC1MT32_9APHY|nr:hypothetical protein NUW54_g12860 [Trametes sanguinea]
MVKLTGAFWALELLQLSIDAVSQKVILAPQRSDVQQPIPLSVLRYGTCSSSSPGRSPANGKSPACAWAPARKPSPVPMLLLLVLPQFWPVAYTLWLVGSQRREPMGE